MPLALVLVASALLAPCRAEEPPRVSFLHALSDFTGRVPFSEPAVALDRTSNEVLVAYQRDVHVFNEFGMEVYRFRSDRELSSVLDLAVEPDGKIVALAVDPAARGDQPRVVATRYDFRGKRLGRIELTGAPSPFDTMVPNRVFSHGKKLVFASTTRMLALRTTREGAFEQGYDLGRLIGIPDDERDTHQATGLWLDDKGNLLFTCAVLFRAFVVSPAGELVEEFGESGSAPGTFSIAWGIARDARGRTFVADKARRVVIVFDASHNLLAEVGGDPAQGPRIGSPSRVLVDDNDRLYVTQVGQAGVWVYRLEPR